MLTRCLLFIRFPIERGLPCDAEAEVKLQALEKQSELKRKLEPYVHRKGAKVLRDELPKLHDTILYLQASSTQRTLLKEHKKHQDRTNFLRYVLTLWIPMFRFAKLTNRIFGDSAWTKLSDIGHMPIWPHCSTILVP